MRIRKIGKRYFYHGTIQGYEIKGIARTIKICFELIGEACKDITKILGGK